MKEEVEKALGDIRPALQADGGDIELVDVTEVEYRQLRLERVVLIGVWTGGTAQDADNSMAELAALGVRRISVGGSFAYAAVKVLQGDVPVNRLHGSLDQNPSQPRRALPRDRALITVAAGLVNSRRQARVGADLLGRAKTLDLADLRDNQQRREQANAVDISQRVHLRKCLPHFLQTFVEDGHLLGVMPKSFEQFVANHVFDGSEVLAAKPMQAARAERRPVGRHAILPRQQGPQLNLDFR